MRTQRDTYTDRMIAVDRPETDPCERGTVGCCIRHSAETEPAGLDARRTGCETW